MSEGSGSPILSCCLTRVRAWLEGEGIGVLGTVSDKEKAEVRALDAVFPGAPRQLCHVHFYQNALKPAVKADRHLATQLRKGVGRDPRMRQYREKKSKVLSSSPSSVPSLTPQCH